ncbi:PMU3 [Candida margitis]|uniref:PMU3 n=1 Tax=Candida margitis TaxID=1775924 RepID=UPI0022262629|nr:PMU3 [Candida margitis]KAI5969863.1 PMU3 [Candida margitis]
MPAAPTELDIIDSQVSPQVRAAYNLKLAQFQHSAKSYWQFSIVPNKFVQSLKDTNDTTFNYLDEHFGKIGEWDDLVGELRQLNQEADDETQYKILFLARHYTGYHNVAHAKYGDDAWNNHWSKLNGDDEYTWGPDAELIPESVELAKNNSQLVAKELENNRHHDKSLILLQKMYVSPLSRSVDTLYYTWSPIVNLRQLRPYIQENWRETTGVHTCDKRSTKTIIANKYTKLGFVIEPGFTEQDELYRDDYRESFDEQAARMNIALQQLFSENHGNGVDIVGITSHSGSIKTQLMVLGHRPFAVQTGGMIPVFVKAVRHKGGSSSGASEEKL